MDSKPFIETLTLKDLDNMCRICLNKDKPIKPILSDQLDKVEIKQMFEFCFNVEINEIKEPPPKSLCDDCLQQLNAFYLFKKRIDDNEITFRQLLRDADTQIVQILQKEDGTKTLIIEDVQINDEKPNTIAEANQKKQPTREHQNGGIGGNRNKCITCGEQFASMEEKIAHQATLGHLYFKCDICDKSYNNGSNLRRHKKTHTNESFVCEHCSKCFTKKNLLERHLESNENGEKCLLFFCEQCGMSYKHASSLRKHKLIHEKPKFDCLECGKKFHFKNVLQRHELSHNSSKKDTKKSGKH